MKPTLTSIGVGSVSLFIMAFLAGPVAVKAADSAAKEGVAVAIVYDTSGSMLQSVRDADGKMAPKYVIASRALNAVLDQLLAAATDHPELALNVGLVSFQGDHAGMAVKLASFDPWPFRHWLAEHGKPQRGTPLGDAVRCAGEAVLKSPLTRKHVLVITDGINTIGPDPTETLPSVLSDAKGKGASVAVHFVAFDVDAHVFDGVKKLGATVVGASNERQLNSQLQFILQKKILLEDEEPVQQK